MDPSKHSLDFSYDDGSRFDKHVNGRAVLDSTCLSPQSE